MIYRMPLKSLCLVAGMFVAGCTSTFEPRMNGGALEPPRLPAAKVVRAGVEVSIEEYYSSHKSRRAFDADLGASGVLPILIHLENKSVRDYRIERLQIKANLNGEPLAPLQALDAAALGALRNPAWNALVNTAALGPLAIYFGFGTMALSASQTQKINRQIEHHFERMELADRSLKPDETTTGFIFFRIPGSARELDGLALELKLDAEILDDAAGPPLLYRFALPTLKLQP